jgi:Fe2+ transport system protein FeoA
VNLLELGVGNQAEIISVGGQRSFRRRLLELGLVPGTSISVLRVAPFGDPLELTARGSSLSIRRQEAKEILVKARSA